MSASSRGAVGITFASGGGGSLRCLVMTSTAVAPVKGARPQSSAYREHPRE